MIKKIISGIVAIGIALAAFPVLAADPTTVANPLLGDACGLDIMLVLDRSGSIDATEMAQMNTAAKQFVDAFLPATPTMMGVVNFDFGGVLDQALTNNTTAIKTAIDSPSLGGGLTNWEDAILKAKAELEGSNDRADATNPDLLVMFSDGDPTTSNGPDTDMNDAVVAANGAKTSSATMPIRILGVGIGSGVTVSSFEKITNGVGTSSIVPPDGITKDTDIIMADFGTLATTLGNLANALCTPQEHQKCCGTTTVENTNDAAVFNEVIADANTGGNDAGGSTGGNGGNGGSIKNKNGNQNVNYAATGNGGDGGNGGVGGTVITGNADASAAVENNINHSTTTINRCQCPSDVCKGGSDVVRNHSTSTLSNGVLAGADSGDNGAAGSQGGQGGGGGAVKNTGGTQNVNGTPNPEVPGKTTGNGGSGGTGSDGGTVRTGKATSRGYVTNNINRNVTNIGR